MTTNVAAIMSHGMISPQQEHTPVQAHLLDVEIEVSGG